MKTIQQIKAQTLEKLFIDSTKQYLNIKFFTEDAVQQRETVNIAILKLIINIKMFNNSQHIALQLPLTCKLHFRQQAIQGLGIIKYLQRIMPRLSPKLYEQLDKVYLNSRQGFEKYYLAKNPNDMQILQQEFAKFDIIIKALKKNIFNLRALKLTFMNLIDYVAFCADAKVFNYVTDQAILYISLFTKLCCIENNNFLSSDKHLQQAVNFFENNQHYISTAASDDQQHAISKVCYIAFKEYLLSALFLHRNNTIIQEFISANQVTIDFLTNKSYFFRILNYDLKTLYSLKLLHNKKEAFKSITNLLVKIGLDKYNLEQCFDYVFSYSDPCMIDDIIANFPEDRAIKFINSSQKLQNFITSAINFGSDYLLTSFIKSFILKNKYTTNAFFATVFAKQNEYCDEDLWHLCLCKFDLENLDMLIDKMPPRYHRQCEIYIGIFAKNIGVEKSEILKQKIKILQNDKNANINCRKIIKARTKTRQKLTSNSDNAFKFVMPQVNNKQAEKQRAMPEQSNKIFNFVNHNKLEQGVDNLGQNNQQKDNLKSAVFQFSAMQLSDDKQSHSNAKKASDNKLQPTVFQFGAMQLNDDKQSHSNAKKASDNKFQPTVFQFGAMQLNDDKQSDSNAKKASDNKFQPTVFQFGAMQLNDDKQNHTNHKKSIDNNVPPMVFQFGSMKLNDDKQNNSTKPQKPNQDERKDNLFRNIK